MFKCKRKGKSCLRYKNKRVKSLQKQFLAIEKPQQKCKLSECEIEINKICRTLKQIEKSMSQREVCFKTSSKQVVQLSKQPILGQTLYCKSFAMPSICSQQNLCVKHHQKHRKKIWCLLSLSQFKRSKQMVVANLCRKVTKQEELYEDYKQVTTSWLSRVKWCSFSSKILQTSQVSRKWRWWTWVFTHLKQLLFLLQRKA